MDTQDKGNICNRVKPRFNLYGSVVKWISDLVITQTKSSNELLSKRAVGHAEQVKVCG